MKRFAPFIFGFMVIKCMLSERMSILTLVPYFWKRHNTGLETNKNQCFLMCQMFFCPDATCLQSSSATLCIAHICKAVARCFFQCVCFSTPCCAYSALPRFLTTVVLPFHTNAGIDGMESLACRSKMDAIHSVTLLASGCPTSSSCCGGGSHGVLVTCSFLRL